MKELTKSLMLNYTAGSEGHIDITTDLNFTYGNRTNLWLYGDNSLVNFTIRITLTGGEVFLSNSTIVNWTGWNKITRYVDEFWYENGGVGDPGDLYDNLKDVSKIRLYLINTTDTNSTLYFDDLNFKPLKINIGWSESLPTSITKGGGNVYSVSTVNFTEFSRLGFLIKNDYVISSQDINIHIEQSISGGGRNTYSASKPVNIDYKKDDSREIEIPFSRYNYAWGPKSNELFNLSNINKIVLYLPNEKPNENFLDITIDEIYLSIPENNDPFTIQNEIHRLNKLIYALDLIDDIDSELNSELTQAQNLNTTANQISTDATAIDFNLNITGVQELKLRKSDITTNLETLNNDIKLTIARLINISHANNNSFRNATNIIFNDAVSEKSIFKIEEFDNKLDKFGEAYKQYTTNNLGRYWDDNSRECVNA